MAIDEGNVTEGVAELTIGVLEAVYHCVSLLESKSDVYICEIEEPIHDSFQS